MAIHLNLKVQLFVVNDFMLRFSQTSRNCRMFESMASQNHSGFFRGVHNRRWSIQWKCFIWKKRDGMFWNQYRSVVFIRYMAIADKLVRACACENGGHRSCWSRLAISVFGWSEYCINDNNIYTQIVLVLYLVRIWKKNRLLQRIRYHSYRCTESIMFCKIDFN